MLYLGSASFRRWAFFALYSILIVSLLVTLGLESTQADEYPETPDDTNIEDTIADLEKDGWITYKYWKVHDPDYTNDYRLIIIYYEEWSSKDEMPRSINAQDMGYSASYGKFVTGSFDDTIYQADTGSFTYDSREQEFALFTDKVTGYIRDKGYAEGWPVPPDETDEQDGDEDEGGEETGSTGTIGDGEETGGNEPESAEDDPVPVGGRETWWGSIVTILVGLTALIAATGPFLSTLLSRGLLTISDQAGTTPGEAPVVEALQGDLPYQPLTDGMAFSQDLAGQEEAVRRMQDRLIHLQNYLQNSIPADRSPAFDRIWDDYVKGDIGEDKLEIMADLLKNETIPLDRINEGYDSFLKWESSRADKAGMVMKTAVTDLAKAKLDPLGLMKGEIAAEAETVGNILKDVKLLEMTKWFGRWSLLGDINEYTKFAIKSYEAAGYLMHETDYPHFDEYLKQVNVPQEEITSGLASTRREIDKYSEKLAEQLRLQKETTLSMTDGDTYEGVKINEKARGDLEHIERMIETYEDILEDLRIEERVYMVRSKGADSLVYKSVKSGDWFIRPDIDGIEKH